MEENKSYAELLKEEHGLNEEDAAEFGELVDRFKALFSRKTTPITQDLEPATKAAQLDELKPFVAAMCDWLDTVESAATNLFYKAYYLTPSGSYEEQAAYSLFRNTYPRQANEFLEWLEAQQARGRMQEMMSTLSGGGTVPDIEAMMMQRASEGPIN
jgi:hypothetical protein